MKIEWKTCAKAGISVFAVFLCIYYWNSAAGILSAVISAAYPLFVGFAIAYILNLLMKRYEKIFFSRSRLKLVSRIRRPVSIILAFVTLLALVALIMVLVVPQLISCVKLIIDVAPDAIKNFISDLEEHNMLSGDVVVFLNSIDWKSSVDRFIDVFTTGVGSVMDMVIGTVSSVFSGIVTGFLSVIFSVYLLSDKEKLCGQLNRVAKYYLPQKWYGGLKYTADVLNDCFRRYIVGQCTEAVILGLLCTAGMLILRLPYATMISALIAFTALIPIAGAYIGAGVGAFMILTVSPVKALIFLVFILILQQLEGNLIYPRVVGSSIGLPGMWVLAAITLGGGIMGIAGMLFGVPLAAAIYRMIKHDMKKGRLNANEKG